MAVLERVSGTAARDRYVLALWVEFSRWSMSEIGHIRSFDGARKCTYKAPSGARPAEPKCGIIAFIPEGPVVRAILAHLGRTDRAARPGAGKVKFPIPRKGLRCEGGAFRGISWRLTIGNTATRMKPLQDK